MKTERIEIHARELVRKHDLCDHAKQRTSSADVCLLCKAMVADIVALVRTDDVTER